MKGTYLTTDGVFTATAYNGREQITGYSLGNGLSTTRGYDGFGFPASIQTPGAQNLAYQFNTQTGNLNWRKDVAKTIQEDFTYDNLMKNRLETWRVNNGGTYTTQYDTNGNINSKTWLGGYHYESARPHAVTRVDKTDNWIERQEQTITYTPFNKVQTIREGDYKLQIIYGPDNERKKTILYRNANSPVPLKSAEETINWVPYKTKYFVGGIYEEEIVDALTDNTSEINYVAGGDGLAAIFVKDNQGENLYYIHKDHLGSYQAASDENGGLQEELYFSPWGNRGGVSTWSYPEEQNNGFYGCGFTGHEHLPEFNLINMNGRVYDPILGRFLSPDNYIQASDYSQSFNRYSYCLNNPLIYTDPSGEFWGWIGAMFGNYVIGGMDNFLKPSVNYKGWYVGLGKGLRVGGMYAGIGTTLYSGYQTIKNPTAENIANTTFGAIGFLGVPGMVVSGLYTYSVDYSIPAYIQRKTTYENKYGTPYIEFEGLCFEGMTKIKMGDSSEKTIQKINVGDIIKTYDFRNKKITSTKVLKVDSRVHNNLIEISFSNNTTNTNTQDHPYFVKGKGWCSFNPIQSAERYDLTTTKLEIGDKCFVYQKGKLKKVKVISIIRKEGAEKTYNLTGLKVGNSYFANGVLVNNESKE